MKVTYLELRIFILVVILILPFNFVLASETNGTIDSTNKYAWSENIGWIDFGCSNCNVTVTDSGMTGYAWSSSYGWINLNPSSYGVINNSEGTLSGQVWGENTGWINFSGVTIDSSGYFSGYASGGVTGSISFNCTNTSSCGSSDFKVRTDWRPASSRSSGSGSSGGGGVIQGMFDKPKAPPEGFKITINSGADSTSNRTVGLSFSAGSNVKRVTISNTGDFKDASQGSYTPTLQWDLCSKFGAIKLKKCTEGLYTVYVKFYTRFWRSSQVFSDSIIYTTKQKSISSNYNIDVVMFTRNLREGVTHTDVKELQKFLNKNGFNVAQNGLGSVGNETTYFGSATINALKRFQEKYKKEILFPIGLAYANGFFGPSTRKLANALNAKNSIIINNKIERAKQTSHTNAILRKLTRTLRYGDVNKEVKVLQELLDNNELTKVSDSGFGSRGNETTYFGSLTRNAVRRFQKKYGIVSFGDERTTGYGLVGPKTRARLQEVSNVK